MRGIFGNEILSDSKVNQEVIDNIKGVNIYEKIIQKEEESYLLTLIEDMKWGRVNNRMCQKYGVHYNPRKSEYKTKDILPIPSALNIPLYKLKINAYNSLTIDLYSPRCIYKPFSEKESIIGDMMVFTFVSSTLLRLKDKFTDKDYDILLKPGSLFLISEEARKRFYLELPKKVIFNGREIKKKKRITFTFRNIEVQKDIDIMDILNDEY